MTQGCPASILLVDDHAPNLVALEAILAPLGERLLRASSGMEALKVLLREEVSLILMDVRMPQLDGFATAELIRARERTRHIPIIFLTASSGQADHVRRGYAHGAVDYLLKPFRPEVLRSKVAALMELHRRAQDARVRERERLEQQSEHRCRSLLDALPLCILALSPQGEVVYANRHARTFAALPDGPLCGHDTLEAVHPEDRSSLLEVRRTAFANATPYELEYRLRRACDGAWLWHLGRGVPEHDESGRLRGWVETATDIEHQKQAEEALAGAHSAKDAFLVMASHELRTPLASAKLQVQLAQRRLATGRAGGMERALGVVDRQVDRIAQLVENLLDVSLLQSGPLPLEEGPVELTGLLRTTVERLQGLSSLHTLSLHAPREAWVRGDGRRLEQVLTHLVHNAIRYSPHGGRVEAHLALEGGDVHVWVRDEGVGIPPARQQDIFERFNRAHGSSYGGLGLGLTIARGIVAQHGGHMSVESSGQPDEGSTFHVHLPGRALSAGGQQPPGEEPLLGAVGEA